MNILSIVISLLVYLPLVASNGTTHEVMLPAPPVVDNQVIESTFNYWLMCVADGSDQNDYLADLPAEYKEQAIEVCRLYADLHGPSTDDLNIDIRFAGWDWPSMTGAQYMHLMEQNRVYLTGGNAEWGSTPSPIIANNIILWKLVDLYTSHE